MIAVQLILIELLLNLKICKSKFKKLTSFVTSASALRTEEKICKTIF
ncbi:hypothetical protein HMPREF0494_0132 [Limosilactobacillus antri DSM 16041]|uniref:Uncharacterized protein n=1 Tax=Limosilactobacillus antri DSM 16041 TaxID=525309 RepID=C8P488_9LACO|nr:hypothetical protein HMPREF0494_0132 [Limosilactobacillus antri DSM 16041]